MHDLATNPETERAGEEREMQDSATSRVEDEVEGRSQGEEGDEVECLVRLRRDVLLRSFWSLWQRGMWKEA